VELYQPLEFESFKRDIDTQGGYMLHLGIQQFMDELSEDIEQTMAEYDPDT